MANLIVTGTGATPPASLATYHVSTELEAVNIMLGAIGELPLGSLDLSIVEASLANDTLYEVSREMQTQGWHFNTEDEYPLAVSNGEIDIPTNCLTIKVTGESDYIVRRGDRLYNRTDHTFAFTAGVEATVILFLAFTDLPQTARTYITLRAARRFQMRVLGSDTILKYTELEEQQAWLAFIGEEVDQAGYSMSDSRLTQNRG